MEVTLKYGKTEIAVSIPDKAEVTLLAPARVPPLDDPLQALRSALDSPVGGRRIEEMRAPGSVAIAVPDPSRPIPFRAILTALLERLYRAYGHLRPENISIVIGAGLHPPFSIQAAEDWIGPDTAPGCRVVIHDAHNSAFMDFGRTSRGTPVLVNAAYGGADLKIVVGQIDPHQFVGFTGGAKGVVIGCASAKTIEHNHGMMDRDGTGAGRLFGNPVREDLNEAGRLVGVDFAVNAVVGPDKELVGLWAGDPEGVLLEGAKVCEKLYGVGIREPFDFALVSCGGHPKDICLYQAQKGLNLCSSAVKLHGGIALLAECREGVGDDVYYQYTCRFESIETAMTEFLSHGFRMGAHKCYLFGKSLTRFDVVIQSGLDETTLKNCHLKAGSVQEAIERWVAAFEGRPRVAVIPNANTTYFHLL